MNTVLLRLGWPNSKLNPNKSRGRHWTYNHKEKAAAKKEGWAEAKLRGAKNLSGSTFLLKVTGYPPHSSRLDDDNFLSSLKHHRDGIAEAMGVDDSAFQWVFEGFDRSGQPGVVIEVVSNG